MSTKPRYVPLFAEPTHTVDPLTGEVRERKPVQLPPMSPDPVLPLERTYDEALSELRALEFRVQQVREQRDDCALRVREYAEKEGKLSKLRAYWSEGDGAKFREAKHRVAEINAQLNSLTFDAELSRKWLPRYEDILRDAEKRLADWHETNDAELLRLKEVAEMKDAVRTSTYGDNYWRGGRLRPE